MSPVRDNYLFSGKLAQQMTHANPCCQKRLGTLVLAMGWSAKAGTDERNRTGAADNKVSSLPCDVGSET